VSNYGIVVTDATHRVLSFQEKPSRETAQSDLASTGIYLFEPQVLDFIPAGQSFDIGSELFPLLVARGLPLYAQKRFFNWVDIGQIPDYWAALQRVMMGEVAEMEIPGTQIRDGVWVGLNTRIAWEQCTITGPVYIGSNCRIAAGSEIIGPTWIGQGCDIGENARIVKSILFEYARAPKDSTLTEVIVAGNYCVDRYGHSLDGEGFALP
jgi:mannose-1-phosphate guanylyltransferase